MTTVSIDYTEFKDKSVTFVYNPEESTEAVEVQGTVKGVTPGGGELLVKPKGKTNMLFVKTSTIEDGTFHLVESGEKQFKAAVIKPVQLGRARSHLLERHSITLAEANNMTEEQAFEYHAGLDHVALDLGHIHAEKEEDTTE